MKSKLARREKSELISKRALHAYGIPSLDAEKDDDASEEEYVFFALYSH